MSQQGRELSLVKQCIRRVGDLLAKADELEITKRVKPERYIWWLCQCVLEVNPHFAEAVGVREMPTEQGKEKSTMMTPKNMRAIAHAALDGGGPIKQCDEWLRTAEICERQDRMLALLERQTDLLEAMFKIVDQPLNCYTKPDPHS
jgi:hypothetical protein